MIRLAFPHLQIAPQGYKRALLHFWRCLLKHFQQGSEGSMTLWTTVLSNPESAIMGILALLARRFWQGNHTYVWICLLHQMGRGSSIAAIQTGKDCSSRTLHPLLLLPLPQTSDMKRERWACSVRERLPVGPRRQHFEFDCCIFSWNAADGRCITSIWSR